MGLAHQRARSEAPLKRSGPGGVRRLTAIVSGVARRIGGGEAAAFDEAAREAFRAGRIPDAPPPLPSATNADSPAARSDALRPINTVLAPMVRPSRPTPEATDQTDVAPSPTRPRRQAGDTAPDLLLRPSAGVPAVADDFFDSLVRRVEGDR
jgi:hypothetical protein